ncbi:hypothetical protein HMPREF0577_2119 [Mobiluncus mulieris ATCC 35243]|nr:hypothetical protein HMPREF0577_2119 [Mobiluncus mulieris ATCC 35243]
MTESGNFGGGTKGFVAKSGNFGGGTKGFVAKSGNFGGGTKGFVAKSGKFNTGWPIYFMVGAIFPEFVTPGYEYCRQAQKSPLYLDNLKSRCRHSNLKSSKSRISGCQKH